MGAAGYQCAHSSSPVFPPQIARSADVPGNTEIDARIETWARVGNVTLIPSDQLAVIDVNKIPSSIARTCRRAGQQ